MADGKVNDALQDKPRRDRNFNSNLLSTKRPFKNSVNSEDAKHEKQNLFEIASSSSSDDETEVKNSKESAITVELPENGKLVIQKVETFNIFTETVKYNAKSERNNSDKAVYCKNIFLRDRKRKFY